MNISLPKIKDARIPDHLPLAERLHGRLIAAKDKSQGSSRCNQPTPQLADGSPS
jgi:hypothetical protein